MSAPEMNASVPAPVSTTTRTSASSWSDFRSFGSALRISTDSAFRFAGLLNVMRATPSATSTTSFSVPVSW